MSVDQDRGVAIVEDAPVRKTGMYMAQLSALGGQTTNGNDQTGYGD
jgi:hypothetical protein